jgi:hypothetical protein
MALSPSRICLKHRLLGRSRVGDAGPVAAARDRVAAVDHDLPVLDSRTRKPFMVEVAVQRGDAAVGAAMANLGF